MLDWIARVTGAQRARQSAQLQMLWGGYGEIVRVELEGASVPTAIVKRVAPPAGARGTISDQRKRRSYAVEHAFYRAYAPRCDDTCRVARAYGTHADGGAWWLVLEDLDAAGYCDRHDPASGPALDACLRWLAAFHARFLGDPGDELWPQGTYWHLATRLDELAAITDATIRATAHDLDAALSAARYQTILHRRREGSELLLHRGCARRRRRRLPVRRPRLWDEGRRVPVSRPRRRARRDLLCRAP